MLVDITNLLTFDVARPLHVFDAGKLQGGLTVRPARAGETLMALNGKEYTLEPGMTVIADDTGVVSLGAVMGGESTGVTETTTDVFLEVALFDPSARRRPAASCRSTATRAIASSAASIPPSSSPAPRSRPA